VHLLSAGAAQGLARAIEPGFTAETGAALQARFGAVGKMRELFESDEPCDVIVLTATMIDALAAAGAVRGETRASLGRVRTGIAVRRGQAHPDVSTAEALKATLLAADAIYFPDAVRSTAGIHFANVLRELGIHDELQSRFRTYPNGATAMRELAAHDAPRLIGCTQVTEINYTEGVELVAPLPARFELATVYAAAVSTRAADPVLAARFIAMLAGTDARALREAGGFED